MTVRLLASFIVIVLFMTSSSVMAMQPRRYTDDDKEFFKSFYESCKKSVTEKLSESDFQKTFCYAHLKGAKEAMEEIGMNFGLLISGYAEESCKELGSAITSITQNVCPPERVTPYEFAKDYVEFVDSEEYKPRYGALIVNDGQKENVKPVEMKKPPKYYMSPVELFSEIYACKRKKNRSLHNVP